MRWGGIIVLLQAEPDTPATIVNPSCAKPAVFHPQSLGQRPNPRSMCEENVANRHLLLAASAHQGSALGNYVIASRPIVIVVACSNSVFCLHIIRRFTWIFAPVHEKCRSTFETMRGPTRRAYLPPGLHSMAADNSLFQSEVAGLDRPFPIGLVASAKAQM
jgi:hypothetical protein